MNKWRKYRKSLFNRIDLSTAFDKLCILDHGCSIILYTDDILLIAPTATKLESLLHAGEH